jgi:hypothetical protein
MIPVSRASLLTVSEVAIVLSSVRQVAAAGDAIDGKTLGNIFNFTRRPVTRNIATKPVF